MGKRMIQGVLERATAEVLGEKGRRIGAFKTRGRVEGGDDVYEVCQLSKYNDAVLKPMRGLHMARTTSGERHLHILCADDTWTNKRFSVKLFRSINDFMNKIAQTFYRITPRVNSVPRISVRTSDNYIIPSFPPLTPHPPSRFTTPPSHPPSAFLYLLHPRIS